MEFMTHWLLPGFMKAAKNSMWSSGRLRYVRSKTAWLDVDKVLNGSVKIVITVTDLENCRPMHCTPTRENIFQLLKATAAIPGVHPPVMVDGTLCVDGALSDPLPVIKAYEMGCTEMVVLTSSLNGHLKLDRVLALLAKVSRRKELQRLFQMRQKQFEKTRDFLRAHPEIPVICPQENLPIRHALDFHHERLNKAGDIGEESARRFLASLR